jgi:hypothetical protein
VIDPVLCELAGALAEKIAWKNYHWASLLVSFVGDKAFAVLCGWLCVLVFSPSSGNIVVESPRLGIFFTVLLNSA